MALDEKARAFWRLAVHPDLGAHFAFLLVLWIVGNTVTVSHTHVRSWATRAGVITFFAMHSVLFWLEPHTLQSPGSALSIVLRTVLVAALVGTAAMSFLLPLGLCRGAVARVRSKCRNWWLRRVEKKQRRQRDLRVAQNEALEHERRFNELGRMQQAELVRAQQDSEDARSEVARLEVQARQRFELTVLLERHFVSLRDVLSRVRFEELLEQSVAITTDAGVVGAAVLRNLIEELHATQGKHEFKDLSEIIEHYRVEREKIQQVALPRADIDSLLARRMGFHPVPRKLEPSIAKPPQCFPPLRRPSAARLKVTLYDEPQVVRAQKHGMESHATRQQLPTHVHLIGGTGTGKTTAIRTITYPLLMDSQEPCAFFLVDPMGNLSNDLLTWMANERECPQHVRDRLIYIEPARGDVVVPFNPLRHQGPEQLYFQVARAVEVVLRAWASQNVEEMPRLRYWMFNAFFAIAEMGMPLAMAAHLLHCVPEVRSTKRFLELCRKLCATCGARFSPRAAARRFDCWSPLAIAQGNFQYL